VLQGIKMKKIYIHDEFDPEAIAMMQALYSRSSDSVTKHAERVKKSGSKKFMESYYVGYGHASIGDCGVTTIFLEGVSILAAKAIQDNPLYSGQETSTRYIDFSTQKILDPLKTDQSKMIQKNWIAFYTNSFENIVLKLKNEFPIREGDNDKTWEKAIQARAFDILRGFLPAGATTQLSWTTNLRQAYEKLSLLLHHPLAEVKDIASECLGKLKAKYPSSFSHRTNLEQQKYYAENNTALHYLMNSNVDLSNDTFISKSNIDNSILESEVTPFLKNRPKWTTLPKLIDKYGTYNVQFLLDYGSFRDLQRHRNGLCQIPVLSNEHGFHPWYLSQLDTRTREEAEVLLKNQFTLINELQVKGKISSFDLQYYFPMGCNVNCELTYSLPEMVYVTELRSSSTVHPTLRKIAHSMHEVLSENHPKLKLYTDTSLDIWDIKRGSQYIEKRS